MGLYSPEGMGSNSSTNRPPQTPLVKQQSPVPQNAVISLNCLENPSGVHSGVWHIILTRGTAPIQTPQLGAAQDLQKK